VRAARDLFARKGFADTSTTEIVGRAGVTRGALYHQFADKEALFRAVYEDVERESTGRIVEALSSKTDPLEQLLAGADAWLDVCLEPDVRRIILQEGPSVLGWQATHEVMEAYGLGLIRAGIEGLIAAGYLEPQPVAPLAHILLGAMNEAGLALAHADDPPAARRELGEAMARTLRALVGGKKPGA
jgi:AcrR family transcriptional regulator